MSDMGWPFFFEMSVPFAHLTSETNRYALAARFIDSGDSCGPDGPRPGDLISLDLGEDRYGCADIDPLGGYNGVTILLNAEVGENDQ